MNFIKGVGVDIAKISRFERIINLYEKGFIRKVLHKNEIEEYNKITIIENKTKYLASRWSFKEALVKATGNKGLIFSMIYLKKDLTGKPFIKFDEDYLDKNHEFKEIVKKLHISISHEEDYAIAFVILEENKMI